MENYINEILNVKMIKLKYVWNSGEALKKDISNGVKIDILFLDIELLNAMALNFSKYIRNYMKNMSTEYCIHIVNDRIYCRIIQDTSI